jgi:hypothetical protein
VAQALVDHRLTEDRGGGGAVTRDVVGLGGDLLGELRTHVLLRVLELDLAGDGDAVVGDGGAAVGLADDDVAAARAERHLDGVGQLVDAALEGAARVLAVGPGRFEDGNRVPLDVKVGDKVLYSKYGGTEVKYAGEEYLVLSARDVLAGIEG